MMFTTEEMAQFTKRHVNRALLAKLEWADGLTYRLHSGVLRKTIDGEVWQGVGNPDPAMPQWVSLEAITDDRFGAAAAVRISLSGVNREFFHYVNAHANEIEGRPCTLYFVVFNGETQQQVSTAKTLFPGRISSPVARWGYGTRVVDFTIEGRWHGMNQPCGGIWSQTGQQKRFPGDTGGLFIGTKVQEEFI